MIAVFHTTLRYFIDYLMEYIFRVPRPIFMSIRMSQANLAIFSSILIKIHRHTINSNNLGVALHT